MTCTALAIRLAEIFFTMDSAIKADKSILSTFREGVISEFKTFTLS